MTPIRVFLADDHTLVRAGIRGLLEGIEGFEVVGEAAEGREALRLVELLRPDVLLLDIGMPGLSGLDVTALAQRLSPRTRTLILSMHASEEYVLQALRAGAKGYLVKGSDVAELEVAIRAVAEGTRYLSPAVEGRADEATAGGAGTPVDPLATLTPRQREILLLVALGHTSREIAQRLDLSVRTVETHRRQLMERLDVHDVAGLVRLAIRAGLITAEG